MSLFTNMNYVTVQKSIACYDEAIFFGNSFVIMIWIHIININCMSCGKLCETSFILECLKYARPYCS